MVNGVRKNGGGHTAEMIEQRLAKVKVKCVLVVEEIGKQYV